MTTTTRGRAPRNTLLISGWSRIGYARIASAVGLAWYVVAARSEAPHAGWIEPIGYATATVAAVTGFAQTRRPLRESSTVALVCALIGLAVGTTFLWLYAYTESQYLFSFLLLSMMELTVLQGRRGALGGWAAALAASLLAVTVFGTGSAHLDIVGTGLRAILALTLVLGTDAVVEALTREREAVRETGELFRTIFEQAPLGIALADVETNMITRANHKYTEMLGYEDGELIGKDIASLTAPADWEQQRQLQAETIEGRREAYRLEKRYVRRDGTEVSGDASISLVRDAAKQPMYWIAQVLDITERHVIEEASRQATAELTRTVRELERRTREAGTLAEMGEMLAACADVDEASGVLARIGPRLFPEGGGAVYVSRPSKNLLETAARWGDMPPDESSFAPDECWALRRGRPHLVFDIDQEVPCSHVTSSLDTSYLCVPLNAQGETLGVLHLRQQGLPQSPGATAEQLVLSAAEHIALSLANFRLRETLRAQSIQDSLTGLFNRRFMTESLERELHRARRADRPLSVVMVDVDHLKHYNDTFGHEGGDRLLREVSKVLAGGIRGGDLACRYGGDEFTLVLPDADVESAARLAERLREAFQHADLGVDVEAGVGPGLSFGVAGAPVHGWDAAQLLRVADEALYRAKNEGRNRVVAARA